MSSDCGPLSLTEPTPILLHTVSLNLICESPCFSLAPLNSSQMCAKGQAAARASWYRRGDLSSNVIAIQGGHVSWSIPQLYRHQMQTVDCVDVCGCVWMCVHTYPSDASDNSATTALWIQSCDSSYTHIQNDRNWEVTAVIISLKIGNMTSFDVMTITAVQYVVPEG